VGLLIILLIIYPFVIVTGCRFDASTTHDSGSIAARSRRSLIKDILSHDPTISYSKTLDATPLLAYGRTGDGCGQFMTGVRRVEENGEET
jgi:hypothetical protein